MGEMVDINNVHTYTDGDLQLIVALCHKVGFVDIMNKHLERSKGRPSDIPAGIEATMILAGVATEGGYKSLYAIKDFYRNKDLEGIYHHPISLDSINDDRFGRLLDDFYDAGCRDIFREVSGRVFLKYGLEVKNINYDTTSKVMWGDYIASPCESIDGSEKRGAIQIDFGHSKQKRFDKKQLKIALGTTSGVVTDAKVLSGNVDDKTYNNEQLEDVDELLKSMQVDKENFCYIADSALFTEKNLIKAKEKGIKFITRIPDNYNVAKELIEKGFNDGNYEEVIIAKSQNEESKYKLIEVEKEVVNHDCKLAVIYSEALEEIKTKSCEKTLLKEFESLEKIGKKYSKRVFKCLEDSEKEILLIEKKEFKKLKYHNVCVSIIEKKKRKRGRPSDKNNENYTIEYRLELSIKKDANKLKDAIRKGCTFVLCSNNTKLTAKELLKEYKTQIDVEKRFRVLKSPTYMNSLFLKTPSRIEALVYLLLIALMILTVAEKIVRDKLKESNDVVYGIDNRKKVKPTIDIILHIAKRLQTLTYTSNGKTVRKIIAHDESLRKILEWLDLSEEYFNWQKSIDFEGT